MKFEQPPKQDIFDPDVLNEKLNTMRKQGATEEDIESVSNMMAGLKDKLEQKPEEADKKKLTKLTKSLSRFLTSKWARDPENKKTAKILAHSLRAFGVLAGIGTGLAVGAELFASQDAEAAEGAGVFDLQAEHPDISEHLEQGDLTVEELRGLLKEGFEDLIAQKLDGDPEKTEISDMLKYVIQDEYGLEDFDVSKLSPDAQKFINDQGVQEGVKRILNTMKMLPNMFLANRDLNKLVEDFQARAETEKPKEQEAGARIEADISQKLEAMPEIKDDLSPEHKTKFNNKMNELMQKELESDKRTQELAGKMTFEEYPSTLSGLMDTMGVEDVSEKDIDWETFQKRMRYTLEHTDDVEQKTKMEQAASKWLFQVLSRNIEKRGKESSFFTVERILDNDSKEANCLGISQVYDLAGDKMGLKVGIVGVRVDNQNRRIAHECNLINYADGSWQLVDVNYDRFKVGHKQVRAKVDGKIVYIDPQSINKNVKIEPLNPENITAQVHLNAAEELREKEQFAKEKAEIEKAIKIDPINASAHYNMGKHLQDRAWEQSKDPSVAEKLFEQAVEHFAKAVNLNQEHEEARANLGGAYHALGDMAVNPSEKQNYYDEALENYQKAIEIDPSMQSKLSSYIEELKAK